MPVVTLCTFTLAWCKNERWRLIGWWLMKQKQTAQVASATR